MGATYKIVEAQLPLVAGAGGHNLLVLEDPNGNVIGELDGLATGSNGQIKPVGYLPSDALKVYEYSSATYYSSSESQATVSSGSQQQIMAEWNAATAAGNEINSLNLSYPFMGLGSNSNSVASTLIAAMGQIEPSIPGSAPITPGEGTLLLTPTQINTILGAYGLTGSTSISGDSYVSSDNPSTSTSPSISVSSGSNGSSTSSFSSQSGTGYADLKDYNSSGSLEFEQVNSIASNGQTTSDISGVGAILDLDESSIALAVGAQAAVDGADNAITAAANVALSIAGSGNTVTNSTTPTSATGTTVTELGQQETVDFEYSTVDVASGASATVLGNSNAINGSNGATIALVGANNTIGASNASLINIGQGSSGDVVTGSNENVDLGTSVGATVVGNSDTMAFNGDTGGGGHISLGLVGTSDTTNLSNASLINFGEGSSGDTVNGSNNTIALGTGVGATVLGNSDTMSFNGDTGGGGGFSLGLEGTSDTVALSGASLINFAQGSSGGVISGASDTVAIGTGVTATITGNSDAASFNGDPNGGNGMGLTLNGSSDSARLSGTGSTAVANGSNDLATDYGTSDTINLNVGSDVADVYGNSNVVDANAAGSTTVALGQSDNIFGTSIVLDMEAGAKASANGNSDTVNVTGSGDYVIASGNYDAINVSNATITFQGNNTHEVITGSNDTVLAGEYDQIAFVGNDDVTDGSYDEVTSDGSGDYTEGDDDTDSGDEDDGGDDGGGDDDGIARVAAGAALQTSTSSTLSNTSIVSGTTHSVADGTTTNISGTITNSGTLALASTGDATTLTVAGSATLSGNGQVTLSDNANNIITGMATSSNLTNNDSLSGAGQIGLGNGKLALVNNSGGTINATGTKNALVINTGKTAIGNSGVLEASGAAGLVVDSVITNNSSGVIEAVNSAATILNNVTNNGSILVNGGDLDINGNVTGTGTVTITGANSVLEFGGTSNQAVTFAAAANDTLKLDNALDFTGTVAGMADNDNVDLVNFLFSSHPTISSVTGTGAAGTVTDVNITNGYYNATLALLNQYANQFAVNSSAYTLTADSTTSPTAGTFLQLAAGH